MPRVGIMAKAALITLAAIDHSLKPVKIGEPCALAASLALREAARPSCESRRRARVAAAGFAHSSPLPAVQARDLAIRREPESTAEAWTLRHTRVETSRVAGPSNMQRVQYPVAGDQDFVLQGVFLRVSFGSVLRARVDFA